MSDRVEQAASQIDMATGESIGLSFASDQPHAHADGHIAQDGYVVTKLEDGSYNVEKDHT